MKKIISTAIAIAIAIAPFTAQAQQRHDPLSDRRTLFVPFGQKKVALELPQGLCFLDGNAPLESGLFDKMKAEVHAEGKGLLMAFFTTCLDVAGIGVEGANAGLPPFMTRGMVVWMNPYIGETFAQGRETFLDVRAASFARYVPATLTQRNVMPAADAAEGRGEALTDVDPQPHRTQDSVSLAWRAPLDIQFEKYTATGITGTTLLRGFPVEVVFSQTTLDGGAAPAKTGEELYTMMDAFMAQQVKLNAQEESQ